LKTEAGGHHADDHLERAGLRDFDLLDLHGVLGLALTLLADHPGGHLLGQLARLDIELGYVGDLYGHVSPALWSWTAGSYSTLVRLVSGTATTFKGPWKRQRSHNFPSTRAAATAPCARSTIAS
jgi:hypothetical protein